MPVDPTRLARRGDQPGARFWLYATRDRLADVQAPDYFAPVRHLLRPGDWILAGAADGDLVLGVAADGRVDVVATSDAERKRDDGRAPDAQ